MDGAGARKARVGWRVDIKVVVNIAPAADSRSCIPEVNNNEQRNFRQGTVRAPKRDAVDRRQCPSRPVHER